MTYYFSILNLYLTCSNGRKTIISDSVEYHTAKFTFDSAWIDYAKTITFTNSTTGISINMVLDTDNICLIPYEVLTASGNLIVCAQGVNGTSKIFTRMDNTLLIQASDKTDASSPVDPTSSVYDQIMTIVNEKEVGALVGVKSILTTDWTVETSIQSIIGTIAPSIITSETSLATGNFNDYLDAISYPYTDFYMDYSTDGITTTRIVASGYTVQNPAQRKIQFTVGTNEYEMRITQNEITLKRTSGTTDYYIHDLLLRFDDIFYYNYEVTGLTTSHKTEIRVSDESKDIVRALSGTLRPNLYDGYVKLIVTQIPSSTINTSYYAYNTDKVIETAEITNLFGSAYYKNANQITISDLDTSNDNDLATVGQIKTYVHSLLGI